MRLGDTWTKERAIGTGDALVVFSNAGPAAEPGGSYWPLMKTSPVADAACKSLSVKKVWWGGSDMCCGERNPWNGQPEASASTTSVVGCVMPAHSRCQRGPGPWFGRPIEALFADGELRVLLCGLVEDAP